MAKKPTPSKATKPDTPKVFKHAARWVVTIHGELFDSLWPEADARGFARALYVDKKSYEAAVRKKEIAVLKVDIRPVKK